MNALRVVVHGDPIGQGSKRLVGGRMIEASTRTRPWRASITTAVLDVLAVRPDWQRLDGPAAVDITFTLDRPASHYGTGRNASALKPGAPAHPHRLPDVDKLARAVLDAITAAGAWTDDARVVSLSASKTYPGASPDALDHPGAVITVTALPATVSDTTGVHGGNGPSALCRAAYSHDDDARVPDDPAPHRPASHAGGPPCTR